jgi:ribosome-associated toxin RatA of RatAB toxin-antitoxin module
MTDQATEQMEVGAPPARCWEVLLDFERYPEWAGDLKRVEVLERDGAGRGTRVAFRAAAMGRSTNYTLAYDYSDEPRVLAGVLERGDLMRKLDGSYVFEPVDDDRTHVTYHLEADLIVPLPGFVKRRAEGRIMGTALRELKSRVEAAGHLGRCWLSVEEKRRIRDATISGEAQVVA